MSPETYVNNILERLNMTNCETSNTHVEKDLGLSIEMSSQTHTEKKKISKVPYSTIVGNLLFAMLYTRPNICYAVVLVSQF